MKLKKIMLVTLVLLAVLTIGAVSAADDSNTNETLTVENIAEVSGDASCVDDIASESGVDVLAAFEEEEVLNSNNADLSSENSLNVTANDINVGEVAVIDCKFIGDSNAQVKIGITPLTQPENYKSYTIDFIDNSHKTIEISNLGVGIYWLEATSSIATNIYCQNYFRVLSPTENVDFDVWALETPTLNIYNESDKIYVNLTDKNHSPKVKTPFATINGRWFKYRGSDITGYGQWGVTSYSGTLNWHNPDLGRFSGDVDITAWYDYPLGQYSNGNIVMGRVSNTSFFSFKSPVEFSFPTVPLVLENNTRIVNIKAPSDTTGKFSFKFEDLAFSGYLEDLRYSAEEDMYYLLIADFVDYSFFEYHLSKQNDLAINNQTYLYCGASYEGGNYFPAIDESRLLFHKLNLTINAVNVKDTVVISVEDDNGRTPSEICYYNGYSISNAIDYTIDGGSTQRAQIIGDSDLAVIKNLQPGHVEINIHSWAGGSYNNPSSVCHLAYATFNFTIRANPKLSIKANDVVEGEFTNIEINCEENIAGSMTVSVDGMNHTVQVNNGYGSLDIPLAAGYHNATLIFAGNDDYFENEAFTEFVVYSNNRIRPNLTVVVNETGMLLENISLSVIVTTDVNLTASLSYNYQYSIYEETGWIGSSRGGNIELNEGYASIERSYQCGSYGYTFELKGNPFYYSAEANIYFNVYRMPVHTNIMLMTGSNNEYVLELFDFFYMSVPNATLSYTINNITYTVPSDGKLDLSYLDEPCEIFVEYGGNEIYNGCNLTFRYTLNPNFNVNIDEPIFENTPFTITISANDDVNGTADVFIKEDHYQVNISNGHAELNISGLERGWCSISVYYNGNEKYSGVDFYKYTEVIDSSQVNYDDNHFIFAIADIIDLDNENATVAGVVLPSNAADGRFVILDGDKVIFSNDVNGGNGWYYDEEGNLKCDVFVKDLELTDVTDGDNIRLLFLNENGDEVNHFTKEMLIYLEDNCVKFYYDTGNYVQFIFVSDDEIHNDDENAIVAGIVLPSNTFGGRFVIFDDDNEIFSNAVRGGCGWYYDEEGNLKCNVCLKDLNLVDVNNNDHLRLVFYDEDGNDCFSEEYFIFFEDDIIRFERDAHNPGDHVNINVQEDVSINDDWDFVWFNLPSDVTDGKVIVRSGNLTLFEESVNFEDGGHWWMESDGHYVCSFAPNCLNNWDQLSTEDVVIFEFMDENGEVMASKDYEVIIDGDNVHFEECLHNSIGFWDENDERGALFTDSEEWVVFTDIIDGSEGTIFIIINGDGENPISWDIECDEWEDFPYHEWNLEDLNIKDAGEYNLTVKCNDDIIAEGTLNVQEWDENSYRVKMDYDYESDELIFSLFCPENTEGTVRLIIEKDEDGRTETVRDDIYYEITSDDYGEWIEFVANDYVDDEGDYHFIITVNDDEFRYGKWSYLNEGHGGEGEYLDEVIFVDGNVITNDIIIYIPNELSEIVDDEFEVWNDDDCYRFKLSELDTADGCYVITVRDLFDIDEVGEGRGLDIYIQFYNGAEKTYYAAPEEDDYGMEVYTSPFVNNDAYLLENGFVVSFRGFEDVDDEFTVTISQEGAADIVKTFKISEIEPLVDDYTFYELHLSDLNITVPGEYFIAVNFTKNGDTFAYDDGNIDVGTVLVRAHGPDEDEDPVISDVSTRVFHIGASENVAGFVRLFVDGVQVGEDISFADLVFDDWPSHYGLQIYLNNYHITENGTYTLKVEVYDENGNFLADCENELKIEVGENSFEFISGPYGDERGIEVVINTPFSDGQYYNIYFNGELAGNFTDGSGLVISDKYLDQYFEMKIFKPGVYDVNVTFFDGENETDITTGSFSVNELTLTSDKAVYIFEKDNIIISFNVDGLEDDDEVRAYYVYYWDRVQREDEMIFNPYGGKDLKDDGLYENGVVSFDAAWTLGEDAHYKMDNGTTLIYVLYEHGEERFGGFINVTVVEESEEYIFMTTENVNPNFDVSTQSNVTGKVIIKNGDNSIKELNLDEIAEYDGEFDDWHHEVNVDWNDLDEGEYTITVVYEDGEGNLIESRDFDIVIEKHEEQPEIFVMWSDWPVFEKVEYDLDSTDMIHIYLNDDDSELSDIRIAVKIGDKVYLNATLAELNLEPQVNDDDETFYTVGPVHFTEDIAPGHYDNVIAYYVSPKYHIVGGEDGMPTYANLFGDSSVTFDDIEYTYGDIGSTTITIDGATVYEDNITVDNHPEAQIHLQDNVITVSGLDVGNYTLKIVTIPINEYYRSIEASANITVKPIIPVGPELAIAPVSDVEEGTNVTISISAAANFTGSVKVLVGDVEVGTADIAAGAGNFTIAAGNFTVGVNTVKVVSDASENFTAGEANVSFNVTEKVVPPVPTPVDPALTISVDDIREGTDAVVAITTNSTFSGNVAVQIGGTNYAVPVVNGTGSLPVSGLAVGNYTAVATFEATDVFNASTKNATFKVYKEVIPDPDTAISTESTSTSPYPTYSINLGPDATGTFSVKIGGKEYTKELKDGAATIEVTDLPAGAYDAVISYSGDAKYAPINKTVNSTVKVATTIKAAAVTTTYGTSKNIVITLTDANGKVLANKKVTVVLNGAKKELTTNAKGQVSYAIGTKLAVKKYDATFTFDGDANYVKSTGTAKVTVNKAKPKLTAKKKTFKAKKKSKKYTVTLKTNKGKAMKKAKVTLTGKFKGKKIKITKKTNSKGKATFNLKKLTKKGKFTAKIKFKGNKSYKAVTKKAKITVKK